MAKKDLVDDIFGMLNPVTKTSRPPAGRGPTTYEQKRYDILSDESLSPEEREYQIASIRGAKPPAKDAGKDEILKAAALRDAAWAEMEKAKRYKKDKKQSNAPKDMTDIDGGAVGSPELASAEYDSIEGLGAKRAEYLRLQKLYDKAVTYNTPPGPLPAWLNYQPPAATAPAHVAEVADTIQLKANDPASRALYANAKPGALFKRPDGTPFRKSKK